MLLLERILASLLWSSSTDLMMRLPVHAQSARDAKRPSGIPLPSPPTADNAEQGSAVVGGAGNCGRLFLALATSNLFSVCVNLPFWGFHIKRNYIKWSFLSGFFYLACFFFQINEFSRFIYREISRQDRVPHNLSPAQVFILISRMTTEYLL